MQAACLLHFSRRIQPSWPLEKSLELWNWLSNKPSSAHTVVAYPIALTTNNQHFWPPPLLLLRGTGAHIHRTFTKAHKNLCFCTPFGQRYNLFQRFQGSGWKIMIKKKKQSKSGDQTHCGQIVPPARYSTYRYLIILVPFRGSFFLGFHISINHPLDRQHPVWMDGSS